ncbi:MAG TPA: nuclear transport factor 2 family protein [Edaphobacter sp.]|jgi:hypothetical protein|nr:nuclear transport factor 2 family protein [Edaphobacter sp.]
MQIADNLKSLEESLLDPTNRRNPEQVSTLLADDFLEFGSSGRTFDKDAILEELRNEPPRPASLLSDFAIRPLAPDVMLVTYRTTRHDSSGQITHHVQRSSIWINRNGTWQITFHQGTPIPSK